LISSTIATRAELDQGKVQDWSDPELMLIAGLQMDPISSGLVLGKRAPHNCFLNFEMGRQS